MLDLIELIASEKTHRLIIKLQAEPPHYALILFFMHKRNTHVKKEASSVLNAKANTCHRWAPYYGN
jgi:hypothetical protein